MGTKGSAFTHNSSDTVHDLTCAILTCAILQQQLRTTCPKVFRLLAAEYQIGYYLRISSKSRFSACSADGLWMAIHAVAQSVEYAAKKEACLAPLVFFDQQNLGEFFAAVIEELDAEDGECSHVVPANPHLIAFLVIAPDGAVVVGSEPDSLAHAMWLRCSRRVQQLSVAGFFDDHARLAQTKAVFVVDGVDKKLVAEEAEPAEDFRGVE